jgi:hypothetical protein
MWTQGKGVAWGDWAVSWVIKRPLRDLETAPLAVASIVTVSGPVPLGGSIWQPKCRLALHRAGHG